MGARGPLLTVGADIACASDCPRVISAGELVLGLVEITGRTPVLPGETRPEDPIDTLVIQKPIGAIRGGPHALSQPALDVLVEPVLGVLADLDRGGRALVHTVHGAQRELDLLL